jgi:hypothetical protein
LKLLRTAAGHFDCLEAFMPVKRPFCIMLVVQEYQLLGKNTRTSKRLTCHEQTYVLRPPGHSLLDNCPATLTFALKKLDGWSRHHHNSLLWHISCVCCNVSVGMVVSCKQDNNRLILPHMQDNMTGSSAILVLEQARIWNCWSILI